MAAVITVAATDATEEAAMSFFDEYEIIVGESKKTAFVNEIGIYQDGTTPMYRDKDGKLWAMSGHSHMGHIGMFCGTELSDMKECYPIKTMFSVGKAGEAFDGIRYPEGILPRGSIWPFGLYICPNTHRFFCFFHNEGGWNGKGTGYDAWGLCEKPAVDSDFRHVGLMHSDDEGKHWVFDRWVLTGEKVCFTEAFNPEGDGKLGQPMGAISFGSGDFSIYVEPDGEYAELLLTVQQGYGYIHRPRYTDQYRRNVEIQDILSCGPRNGVIRKGIKFPSASVCAVVTNHHSYILGNDKGSSAIE